MKNYELRITNYQLRAVNKILCILCALSSAIFSANAQSTSQNYPTAITANEISGRIAARDVGDARLTSYFYIFSGGQGDVFINVQTSNFNGDVDIFTAGNLKPLTKITIYADDATSETGRVVYLRQPAKLILRVEGRSPNDDAATFRIKFAGSFEPVQAVAENSASEIPEVKSENQTDVRVNSVGTIVEVKPKPPPPPKETIAKKEAKPRRKKSADAPENKGDAKEKEIADDSNPSKANVRENATEERKEETTEEKREPKGEKKAALVVIVTDDTAKQDETKTDRENSPEEAKEKSVEKTTETPAKNSAENKAETAVKSKSKSKPKKVKEPNPLENVHLIILFKDGTRIERAMSEVIKVGVDKGTLTVISKDGSIGRYSILDVAKMTIE
ncbi:MAG TPA: hypothetical protein VNI60_03195 [Pyrinomonadaceae bacterium]|nr:hypothetical protein [Pyrinomonadaceae bacterium]